MNRFDLSPENDENGLSLAEEIRLLRPDYLEDRIIRLPCYEPAGLSIELTVQDLLRHVLIIGQTGAGKTTLNNRILENLINYRSSTTHYPAGLLILDAQGDGTAERVRNMAAQAGRLDDVRVLSSDEGYLDPVGNLRSFDDLDLVVSKIISSSKTMTQHQHDNAYWAENTRLLIESGLCVLLVTENKINLHRALHFLSGLLIQGNRWPDEIAAQVARFEKIIATADDNLSAGVRAKLSLIQATLASYKALDTKTRGILQTCVGVVLAPFLSVQALRYWDSTKGNQVFPAEALDGKIVVLSVNGSSEPEAAALLSRLVKMEFYRAAQTRLSSKNSPLVGIVMDELPLCVTTGSPRFSDINALATLRGKGVFVIAATQGLANLDLVIHPAQTQALLINFSNLVLLRSQETGFLYSFAKKLLGNKEALPRQTGLLTEIGQLLLAPPLMPAEPVPVCPEGALARLEPHQAYVALASGYRSLNSVWLAPLYFDLLPGTNQTKTDTDLNLLRQTDLRLTSPAQLPVQTNTFKCSLQLYHLLLSPPRRSRSTMTVSELFRQLRKRHHVSQAGLETLPKCWHQACLNLAQQLPENFQVLHLACTEGVLQVEFIANSSDLEFDFSQFGDLEKKWQLSVYPSRLRLPHGRDQIWLERDFPDLLLEITPTKTENKKKS